jgi:hypothetical protein
MKMNLFNLYKLIVRDIRMKTYSKNQKVASTVTLIVVVLIVALGDLLTGTKSNNHMVSAMNSTNMASSKSVPPAKTCSNITDATMFKDGSYNANGTYTSPGGEEEIKVNLTLSGGTITTANAVSGANDPTASSYQSYFIGGFKPLVIGKKITEVKLTNVSGSSLTSQGFNKALQSIECSAEES